MNYKFAVSVEINEQTGDVMAAYFQLRRGRAATVKEFAKGAVFANYDRRGELLGIEMLAPCKASVLDRIGLQSPAKRFIKKSMPRQMASG